MGNERVWPTIEANAWFQSLPLSPLNWQTGSGTAKTYCE